MSQILEVATMEELRSLSQNALDEALEDLNEYSDKDSPNYQLLLESYHNMKELHDQIFNLQ